MTVYIGIDIASKKFDAASLCDGAYRCKTFENTPAGFTALYNWLKSDSIPDIHVCLEATGSYGTALATFLYEKNLKVSVVNPARIKGFAVSELTRTKTDKADSRLIARFCKAAQPDPWRPVPAPVRKLQALVRRIGALNGMLRMECNRRENADIDAQESVEHMITHLKMELESVRRAIKEHISNVPELKKQNDLLLSIPGIGAVSASLILSFMASKEFTKAKEVTAFLGLTPRLHQSGTSVRGKTRMSKMGDAKLRCALYMPALVALKHNPDIRAFGLRLLTAGKPRMLVVGAIMRKLIHIIFGVLKSGTGFSSRVTVNAGFNQ
ncbi:IS110 family transposase [Salmonella enterica subsp. enterica serovar Durban]|nr:IS110 family transposase [Salmonella enterica]EEE1373622.1 IS110 family transposase [Salmonella enterica subsp. enterica serovar Durban]